MEEVDVFGVEDPDTGDIGFVSLTGMLGEHLSVTVYPGARALYQFLSVEEEAGGEMAAPERILEIPQLQASYEERGYLEPEDHEIIKALGLRYRGAHGWPMFRSWRPGYHPWFVSANEARFLTVVLGQVLDVAPRFREDIGLFDVGDEDEFFVRKAARSESGLRWKDEVRRVVPPAPRQITSMIEQDALEAIRRLPVGGDAVEVDFFLTPAGIRQENGPSVYAYALLLVHARAGTIAGHELLTADQTLEAMWGALPGHVANHLASGAVRPSEIRVRSDLLEFLLQPVAAKIGVRLTKTKRMDALDHARRGLEGVLARR